MVPSWGTLVSRTPPSPFCLMLFLLVSFSDSPSFRALAFGRPLSELGALLSSSVHIYSNVSRIEMDWGFYRNHLWFQVFLRAFCSINCLEKEGTHYGFSLMVFSLLVRSWSVEFPHSPLFYHIFGSPCDSLSPPAEKPEWAPSKARQILPISGGCSDSISSFFGQKGNLKVSYLEIYVTHLLMQNL